jgi:hypothetical protein
LVAASPELGGEQHSCSIFEKRERIWLYWPACGILIGLMPASPPTSYRLTRRTGARATFVPLVVMAIFVLASAALAAESDFPTAAKLLQRYCFDCHSNATAEGQVNLEQMAAQRAFNTGFRTWEKVASVLESDRMPPRDMPQPTADERRQLVALIRGEVSRVAEESAGDPGQVVLRRLTSAEYAYTIQDLTGLDLDLDREFVSDAAGGEGFTNVGSVQFLDDSGLARYLEAAKKVAAHAVIGTGPLQFFADPGKTGLELSAIHRIRQIYRDHGFRTAAGEGGVPFGLDRYPKAFFAAWRYQHRERLGIGKASLESLAVEEGLQPQFVSHVWSVLNKPSLSFPASEIVAKWHQLPAPRSALQPLDETRAACDELYRFMTDWQTRLAKAVGDEEEAPVLSESSFQVEKSHRFFARFAWNMEVPAVGRVQFSVIPGDPSRQQDSVVVWRNARMRFRRLTRRREESPLLTTLLTDEAAKQFAFGVHPRGGTIGPNDFVTIGAATRIIELPVPEGARGVDLVVETELDLEHGENCVVRCSLIEGDDPKMLRINSALLADPAGEPFLAWKTGVIEFARLLPQVSHREPAPSDRDPIPFPFLNTYNMPERNFFHTGVKYHRDDAFFTRYLLDDATRTRLDQAWMDLLGSFEYHDILLRFTAEKFQRDLGDRTIAILDDAWIQGLPEEPKQYVARLKADYVRTQEQRKLAERGHLDDVVSFASRAWRRLLSADEGKRLRDFYAQLRREQSLGHAEAVRGVIARILVAPDFVYRAERPQERAGVVALTGDELASRLSFLIWSSLPDDELRRAAAAGELRDPEQLARQTRRMLHDPKARRLATEFFGQWLGFYQFDRFRGVDPERFPEFNDKLKAALYDESISFFEHIVRDDRPAKEILFADYAFLSDDVARHYGFDVSGLTAAPSRVAADQAPHRGGLFGLGAVLTVTSAPLRTSPVKRGDWILRRVLGTPVPPPPANAGSIAADDTPADGKTVRQRLEAHRQDATCINCHSRIDPLGFALEHYDSLGRWRATYRNDEPIDDAITLAGGAHVAGPDGLRRYMAEHQDQFYRTLCGKLLAYSLGRGELASDRHLMQQMLDDVQSGDGSLGDLIVDMVQSKQFRHRRGPLLDEAAAAELKSPREAAHDDR